MNRDAARELFCVSIAAALVALAACGNGTQMAQSGIDASGAGAPGGAEPVAGIAGGAGSTGGRTGGTGGSGLSGTSGAAAGTSGGETGGTAGSADAAGAGGAAGIAGAAGSMQTGGAGGATNTGACTRDFLKATVETYFTALAAHDPEMLPLADAVKFTENGETLQLGEGLWANAGVVKFKESLFDVQTCGTVTQAVVPDGSTDIPLALRLKVEARKITQIETIAVRSGDYLVASNTGNMIELTSTPWEMLVPEDQRQTREQLESWIDKYFRMFPMGGCNLSSDCTRMENGFSLPCSTGATCSSQEPSGSAVMTPRLILADVEAGLAAGFVMFQGRYTDVHMIKYAGGQVHGVHTILGSADSSGWD